MLSQRSSNFSSGKQKLWPDPKDSTGMLLSTLGRNKCVWEAIGPARVAFNVLQNTIAEYLDQICEPLSGDVVWSLYMVGRTRETASPTITFSSREPGPRQKVKTHIKQSTILEDYPGFITMDIDRPPGCRNSVVTTLGELDGTKGCSPTIHGEVSVTVGSENFMGTCIYLPGTSDMVATGGGLLRFKDKFFMSSVAHPFENHWKDRFPEETPPPRNYVFNIDGMSDSDEEENDMVEKTSGGSVTSNSTLYDTTEYSLSIDNCSLADTPRLQEESAATTSPTSRSSADSTPVLDSSHLGTVNSQIFHKNAGPTIGSQEPGVGAAMRPEPSTTASQFPLNTTIHGPAISSARGGTIGSDYAMFEVPSSIHGQNFNMKQRRSVSTPREPRSTKVIVYTASGPVAGRTLATASFLQPTDGMLPQQLWTVIMEGTLRKGLCGSWVVDPATDDVFGHIIAGAPEDGLAYLVPFYEIIDDLNHHFGDGWELLGSEETFKNVTHEVTHEHRLPACLHLLPPRTEEIGVMGEPIPLVAGLLALATVAFQSTVALCKTIQSFQYHPKPIRDLEEELEALSGVLGSLAETISAITDVDLSALKVPLLRCGKACGEFEQEIIKCSSRSGGNRTRFRDWAKLKYMGDDIDGFRHLLAGYKSTIDIALTDVNIRKSSITTKGLEDYKVLIKTATDDLEERLQSIDTKLETIFRNTITDSDTDMAELQLLKEERISIQNYLQIRYQLSDDIDQIQLNAWCSGGSAIPENLETIPERLAYKGQQECKNCLVLTVVKLERNMKDVIDRMVAKSKTATSLPEDLADLVRLQEEWETTRQCIDICSRAGAYLKENTSNIDNYTTGDATQIIVSTTGETIHVENQGIRGRTMQIVGHLSDDSLQKLSQDITTCTFQNNGKDGNSLSNPNGAVDNKLDSEFNGRYRTGYKPSN